MAIFRLSLKSLVLLMGTLVLVTLVGTLIATQLRAHLDGPSGGVIHSCVDDEGEIRIIADDATCDDNDDEVTSLDWNTGRIGIYSFICGKCFLPDIKLVGEDLSNAWLPGADLTRADLDGAILIEANLAGAILIEASLIGAVLTKADLTDAILGPNAVLSRSDLTQANLTGATGLLSSFLDSVIWNDTTCPDGSNSDDINDASPGTCLTNG